MKAAADAAAARHRAAARRDRDAAWPDGRGRRRCWSSAASRARCATSTRAAATASSTTCSSWPAAPTCSAICSKQSVEMSTEMILTRAPEVIIELHYGDSLKPAALDAERQVWNALASVPAVRNDRVYLLSATSSSCRVRASSSPRSGSPGRCTPRRSNFQTESSSAFRRTIRSSLAVSLSNHEHSGSSFELRMSGAPGVELTKPGHRVKYPDRIVCLTEETTETLYLLGQGDRIVGVSGYTVRPPEARQKPKVSAFINAKFDKIEALQAGPRAGVLRSAGRSRRRARAPRHDGRHVQPADRSPKSCR